uniref:BRCT domain-containing protein n=1 Tax=Panagrolaimus sp. ES5 TaxID=591445 RepID=A0AC34GTA3_9BILA
MNSFVKPSKAYEEAQNAVEEASKKLEEFKIEVQKLTKNLEEVKIEEQKWTKVLEEATKRKEYLSKTRQTKKSLSPRRKSTAMSMRSPGKPGGSVNSQLVKTTLNDDGELIQVFEEPTRSDSVVPKVEGNAANMAEDEIKKEASPVAELPSCPNYDPIQCVAPHRVTNVLKDLDKAFTNLYFQPSLPDNDIKIPAKKIASSQNFFLFKLPDGKEPLVREYIEKLGGKVVDCLESATRLIFCPSSKKLPNEEYFFFATAAAGGRFLLPTSYIAESYDAKKFLDPSEFSTYDYYFSRHDLHSTMLAAIKMSVEFRSIYAKNGNPCFYLHNVLFAEPKGEHEDVMLFLRICGAFVQPFYGINPKNNEWISNYTITLIVNSGKVALTENLKNFCVSTPDKIRNILWRALARF